MGRPMFWDDNFMITQDIGKSRNCLGHKTYYTVVKEVGLHKKNPHAHFNNYRAAKLALHFAKKGHVPNRYSGYMKSAIRKLLKTREEILEEMKDGE